MKSIGELKSAKLDRCEFDDIFQWYEDITPDLKECLDTYLSQFVKPNSKCIRCEAKLNTLSNLESTICTCNYPHKRKHEVECDGEIYRFETLALQIHPSELRG